MLVLTNTWEGTKEMEVAPFPPACCGPSPLLGSYQMLNKLKVVAPKQWNAWQEPRELTVPPFGEILEAHKPSGTAPLWPQHWLSPEIIANHHTGNTLTIILGRTPISLISFHLAISVGQLQSDQKVKWSPLCDFFCWTALFCAYPTENSLT